MTRLPLLCALLLATAACGGDDGRDQAFVPGGSESSSTGELPPETSSSTDPGTTSTSTTTSPVTTDPDPSTGTSTSSTASGESSASSTGVQNDCPRAEIDVAAGATLNVRPDPSTANAPVGVLTDGTIVDVLEEVTGENIDGVDLWYHIANTFLDGYVLSSFAVCTLEEPPDINPNGYYLPLPCGMSATISQGNNGGTSHQGNSFYAFDFAIPLNTPLVAIADGQVAYTFDETGPGDPCYNGGDSSCTQFANYVILRHADGSLSTYRHLNRVDVAVGDIVPIGSVVGLSGSTGYSTGRHAHVMRMMDCGMPFCQSIETSFMDVPGNGIPSTGDTVTSGNCP